MEGEERSKMRERILNEADERRKRRGSKEKKFVAHLSLTLIIGITLRSWVATRFLVNKVHITLLMNDMTIWSFWPLNICVNSMSIF